MGRKDTGIESMTLYMGTASILIYQYLLEKERCQHRECVECWYCPSPHIETCQTLQLWKIFDGAEPL